MLSFLNRNLLQPLHALKHNSRHLRYLRILERTQYDDPEVVRRRQWVMLKRVLDHAYRTVPYYRAAFDGVGAHPDDIRTPRDLAQLPVLTKARIRSHERGLLSDRYRAEELAVKRTSGSTGVPLTVRIDRPAVEWKTACTLRSDQWSGWRLGGRVAKVDRKSVV